MFGFGSSSKKSRYGVIFDISSGSVGVGIVESNRDQKLPRVIFSHRVSMRISKTNLETTERMRQMRETLFSASLLLSREGMQALSATNSRAKIDTLFVVCSSPWAQTISRDINFESENNFKITQELINDLAVSAEHQMEVDLQESSSIFSGGFEIVERATIDVRVNGYSIHNPLGLEGTSVSLSHITGFVLKDILDATAEVRDKIFTDTSIQAHTSMLVLYCVFRDLFPKTPDSLLVHVTGEATEVGLTEKNSLRETYSILYGSNSLVREISKSTNQTPENVTAMLRGYAENRLNEPHHTLIDGQSELYDGKLLQLFTEIYSKRNIPRTVVITAEPMIQDFIRTRVLTILTRVTSSEHTVLNIKQETLLNPSDDSTDDVQIGIQSRFFHKLHGCGEMDAL